jgi:hypothetical protein
VQLGVVCENITIGNDFTKLAILEGLLWKVSGLKGHKHQHRAAPYELCAVHKSPERA